MAATQAGRATTCLPRVSWLIGLRRPAQQILLVVSLAGIVAGTLLWNDHAPSTGKWLLAGGVMGLLLVALVMGGIRATGGEVELGIVSLPLELVSFRRRLEEAAMAEAPGLQLVACRLCGDEDTARRLVEEVAYLAGRRWPDGTGARFERYLYCELLTRAAADEALGAKPDQRAYLADQYGEVFAGLDPLARTQVALERIGLPSATVEDLLTIFAGTLARHGLAPDAAMGTSDA
jgi:hypothetical protein